MMCCIVSSLWLQKLMVCSMSTANPRELGDECIHRTDVLRDRTPKASLIRRVHFCHQRHALEILQHLADTHF